jgi:hypothetical protein
MMISIQQAQIATLYIGYFNGPADPAGLACWAVRLDEGMPLAQIAQFFSVERRRQDILSTGARLRRRGRFVDCIYSGAPCVGDSGEAASGLMQFATVPGKPDPDRSLFQGGMASRFWRSDADAAVAVSCDRPLSRSERFGVLPVRVQSSIRRQSDSRSAAKASMNALRSRPSHIE